MFKVELARNLMLLASEFLGLGDEPYKGSPSTTVNHQIFITEFDMLSIYESSKMFFLQKKRTYMEKIG